MRIPQPTCSHRALHLFLLLSPLLLSPVDPPSLCAQELTRFGIPNPDCKPGATSVKAESAWGVIASITSQLTGTTPAGTIPNLNGSTCLSSTADFITDLQLFIIPRGLTTAWPDCLGGAVGIGCELVATQYNEVSCSTSITTVGANEDERSWAFNAYAETARTRYHSLPSRNLLHSSCSSPPSLLLAST